MTFYELLTGRRPFQGSVLQLLSQIREETPVPPSRYRPDLDRPLEAICSRMMAKRASDRFPSMEEVADALDRWLGLAAERSETASELRDLRRRLNLLGVAGGLVAGGLGLLGLANLLGGGTPDGDAAGPGCDPATGPHRAGPHAEARHSPFEGLLAGLAQVEKADPHFGTPGHDRAFWEGQQNYADTCAIRCQEFILHQFTGVDLPESLLVDEAMQRGWYTPGQGTDLHDVGKLLELHGVAVNRYTDANVFHLAHELAQGHKVIIGVDSGQLWGHNPTMDEMLDAMQDRLGLPPHADHAVVVSGIDTTDPHHVRVILSAPGDGQAVASDPLAAGEPLDNRPWLALAEEAVGRLDELERHRADFDGPRAEVADHVVSRLCEILERCGVESIDAAGGVFDRTCHQPDGPVRPAPGARVIATLSPGFRVGPRVLRRARVRVESPGNPGRALHPAGRLRPGRPLVRCGSAGDGSLPQRGTPAVADSAAGDGLPQSPPV